MGSVGVADVGAACVGAVVRRLNSLKLQAVLPLAACLREGDAGELVRLRVPRPSVPPARPRATPPETEAVAVPPVSDAQGVKKRRPAVAAAADAVDAAVDAKRLASNARNPSLAAQTAKLAGAVGAGAQPPFSFALRAHRTLRQVGRKRRPPVAARPPVPIPPPARPAVTVVKTVRDRRCRRPVPDAVAKGKPVVYKHAGEPAKLPAPPSLPAFRPVWVRFVLPLVAAAPAGVPNARPQRALILGTGRLRRRDAFARPLAGGGPFGGAAPFSQDGSGRQRACSARPRCRLPVSDAAAPVRHRLFAVGASAFVTLIFVLRPMLPKVGPAAPFKPLGDNVGQRVAARRATLLRRAVVPAGRREEVAVASAPSINPPIKSA